MERSQRAGNADLASRFLAADIAALRDDPFIQAPPHRLVQ